jgi:MoaA/NifB/PqqE/SkfB family radical SAM enzyme
MDKKITKPKRVIVEITDRCNFRCKHCFANKNDLELSLSSWKKIFENIFKEKIQSVTITGGEPLLYRELFDLLESLHIKKTILALDTNASLINENNIKFIEKYFKKIRVSYYGFNRSWHANTNSNAFDEERFKKVLKLLCESKLFVQVKIPLFPNNVKKIYKILDGLKEFNIDEIVLIPIIPVGKAKNLSNLVGQRYAKQLIKTYGDTERNIKVFRWVKGKHFLIRSNGNVVLHPMLKREEFLLGNAMDRPISELWDRVPEKFKEINSDFTNDLSQLV